MTKDWLTSATRITVCLGPAGLSPRAPGTVGSCVAAVAGYGLNITGGPLLTSICALFVSVVGWFACRAYIKDKPSSDPQEIVIDEAAGQLIASAAAGTVLWLHILSLCAFRVLDIIKPGPVGWAERLPGASGIMADDIIAGFGAAIVVLLTSLLLGSS